MKGTYEGMWWQKKEREAKTERAKGPAPPKTHLSAACIFLQLN